MTLLLTDRQRFEWLRLIRTEGIGPRTFRSLVNRFGGAGAALAELPELARAAGRSVRLASEADIEREMEQARRLGVRFVAMGEAAYPLPLMASQTAPPVIAVRGSLAVLSRPMVAMVGSRNASGTGLKFTEMLARDLGEAGFVIVSGLARGIDTAAHRASLDTGTVAVLAGGQGQIYPAQNEPLVEELIASGAAISELPFAMEPRARDFPRRNRIVAALSMAVVVVEAARKSGSLITARLALEEGREVFAVPGSPMDPRAEGANDLIHEGRARICRNAGDIIAELQPQLGRPPRSAELFEGARREDTASGEIDFEELDWLLPTRAPTANWSATGTATKAEDRTNAALVEETTTDESAADPEARIVDLIGATPLLADDVVRLAGLRPRIVMCALTDLEMRGLICRDPSGGYVRASS